MTNTLFTGRALLPALLAAAFGGIALALALLIVPGPAASQAAPPGPPVATVRFVGDLTPSGAENTMIMLRAELLNSVTATRTIMVMVDYDGTMQTLTIASGQNGGTLTVALPDDDLAGDQPNPVVARLLAPQNDHYNVDSMRDTVTITVTDDDTLSVGFGTTDYSGEEGTEITVAVELKGSASPSGNVDVTVQGFPDPNDPDQTEDKMVTFVAGSGITSHNITFDAPDDRKTRASPDDVTLTIASSSDYDIADGFGTATVSFIDDMDPLAEVSFSSNLAPSADEGSMITLTVSLQPGEPATRAIDVRLDLTGGITGERTVRINNNDDNGTIQIQLPTDNIAGTAPADVIVTLVDRRPGATSGRNDQYDVDSTSRTVTIDVMDDDRLSVGFGFAETSSTAVEGEQVMVRVEFKTTVNPVGDVEVTVEGLPDPSMPSQTVSRTVMLDSANRLRDFTFNAPDDEKAYGTPDDVALTITSSSGLVDVASGFGQANVRITDDNDPVAEVRFVNTSGRSGPEGTMVTLRAQLQGSQNATRAISVRVQFSGSGMGTQQLTIPNNMNGGEITITLPNDDVSGGMPDPVVATLLDRNPEVAHPATLRSEAYNVVTGADRMITITVDDDDTPSVGFGATSYTVLENSPVTVPVEFKTNIRPANPITVMVTIDHLPGGQVTRMVTLSAGDTSADVTFMAPDDRRARLAPSNVDLEIVSSSEFNVASGFGTTIVRLRDDGDPIATVGFRNPPTTLTEKQVVMLNLELTVGGSATQAVTVTVTDGVDVMDGGFSEDVTIDVGQSTASVSYTAPDDTVAYGAPAARMLRLINPKRGSVDSSSGSAVVNFRDDGDPVATVRFVGDLTPSGLEGTTLELRAELLNSVVATTAIRVDTQLSGGLDRGRSFNISQGANFGIININLPTDNIQGQAPDPVVVTLRDRGQLGLRYNVVSGMGEEVTITVTDDDVVSVGFGASSYTVTEGSGTVSVPVELQGTIVPANPISVTVQGGPPDQTQMRTLTLDSATTSTAVTFTAPDDELHAPPPPVTLSIDTSTDFNLATNLGMTTVSFTDEGDPIASVGFMSPPTQLTEGEMVTLNLALMAGGPATRAITVTVSDGVTGGFSQDVMIQNGQDSVSFTYTAPNDQHAHISPATRTLQLMLDLMDGMLASGSDSATIIYRDDSDPLATVGFMSPPTHLTEGEMVTLNLALMAGGPATRAITVTVTDGEGLMQDVTIPNGQSSVGFSYTAPDDDDARISPPTRTLELMINPIVGILASGADSASIIYRDDNDPLATVRFVDPPTRLTEDEMVTLRVELEGGAVATRAITVAVMDGRGFSETVTIQPGQSSTSFSFTAPGDLHANIAPPTRTLQLMLDPMEGMLASGAASAASISFRDDGDALAVVGFAPRSDRQILQGGRVTFVAQLQGGVTATRAVDVQLMFSDGRAPETVTIEQGQSMVEYVLRTTSSGPTPPPLRLTLGVPGGQALNADAASATLMQIPPVVGAEVPSAGGLELGWGALAVLLAFALALVGAGGLLLTPHHVRRRPR